MDCPIRNVCLLGQLYYYLETAIRERDDDTNIHIDRVDCFDPAVILCLPVIKVSTLA